jgi:hypothetical protein
MNLRFNLNRTSSMTTVDISAWQVTIPGDSSSQSHAPILHSISQIFFLIRFCGNQFLINDSDGILVLGQKIYSEFSVVSLIFFVNKAI